MPRLTEKEQSVIYSRIIAALREKYEIKEFTEEERKTLREVLQKDAPTVTDSILQIREMQKQIRLCATEIKNCKNTLRGSSYINNITHSMHIYYLLSLIKDDFFLEDDNLEELEEILLGKKAYELGMRRFVDFVSVQNEVDGDLTLTSVSKGQDFQTLINDMIERYSERIERGDFPLKNSPKL